MGVAERLPAASGDDEPPERVRDDRPRALLADAIGRRRWRRDGVDTRLQDRDARLERGDPRH